MLRSMTGFGRAQGQVCGVEYVVEARSLNNRYFRLITKLPEAFASSEIEIEKLIRGRITRGMVTVVIHMKLPDHRAAGRINTEALAAYVAQLEALEVEANPTLRIDLGSLLQLPGVCDEPALDEVRRQTEPGLMELVGKALDDLEQMRRREGLALQEDLLNNCDHVAEGLERIAARAPQVVKDYQKRLTARVAELTQDGLLNIDQDSLAREVAIFAERSDISEEIARLSGHLEQFRQSIADDEPAGRKLEFIATEMLREANTIAANSSDTEIAREVVEIKTAIDRIKEQVQNAE